MHVGTAIQYIPTSALVTLFSQLFYLTTKDYSHFCTECTKAARLVLWCHPSLQSVDSLFLLINSYRLPRHLPRLTIPAASPSLN
jgi:hypothetical protein